MLNMNVFHDYWLVVWNIFSISYMGCHPNPIDFHSMIFQRGRYTKPPTIDDLDAAGFTAALSASYPLVI